MYAFIFLFIYFFFKQLFIITYQIITTRLHIYLRIITISNNNEISSYFILDITISLRIDENKTSVFNSNDKIILLRVTVN